MEVFVDPSPIRSVDLTASEMAGVAGGTPLPIFVATVVYCGATFGPITIVVLRGLE